MITRAVLKYLRITPRKFRLIIPIVKGRNPEEAIAILAGVNKGAAKYAIELLKSAVANARRKQGVDVSALYISKMVADCGPTLKRFRAASMGRASAIRKHTCHVTVELDVAPVKIDEAKSAKAMVKKGPRVRLRQGFGGQAKIQGPAAKSDAKTTKMAETAAPKKMKAKE